MIETRKKILERKAAWMFLVVWKVLVEAGLVYTYIHVWHFGCNDEKIVESNYGIQIQRVAVLRLGGSNSKWLLMKLFVWKKENVQENPYDYAIDIESLSSVF